MALDFSRIDAVLFDVDGTLRNTDDEAIARVETILGPVMGRGREAGWARPLVTAAERPVQGLLGLADRVDLDGVLNRLLDWLAPRGRTCLVAGAADALQSLSGTVGIGVVSAGPERQVRRFLDEHDLHPFVDVVVTGQTYRRTKPHADPLLGALRTLGVAPGRAVMVGDTTVDIKAGRAAGTQTLGVLTGFGRHTDLLRCRPTQVDRTLSPLVDGIVAHAAVA